MANAADHHRCALDGFVGGCKRCLLGTESPPHDTVHIEAGRGEGEGECEASRFGLRNHDDGIGLFLERITVRITELRRVGQRRITGNDLERQAQRLKCGHDSVRIVSHVPMQPGVCGAQTRSDPRSVSWARVVGTVTM